MTPIWCCVNSTDTIHRRSTLQISRHCLSYWQKYHNRQLTVKHKGVIMIWHGCLQEIIYWGKDELLRILGILISYIKTCITSTYNAIWNIKNSQEALVETPFIYIPDCPMPAAWCQWIRVLYSSAFVAARAAIPAFLSIIGTSMSEQWGRHIWLGIQIDVRLHHICNCVKIYDTLSTFKYRNKYIYICNV